MNRPVINYITHRPYTVLPKKFAGSLSKICDLRIRTSWLNPTQESVVTLTRSFRTAVRLSSLSLNSVVPYKHVFLDSMDSLVVWPALCRSIVLEYSTSLPAELEWLGYPRFLVEQARRIEAFVLTHSTLITTPNELFMNHAQSQGGKRFCITPNYPLRSFVPKVESSIWRKKHEIRPETKVAIFIGGGHMREIYGLDLLLESWRQVEAAQPDSLLLMIGPFHGIDSGFLLDKLKLKHVKTLGTLPHDELPEWIQIGNACLAPRTPGFPSIFYNDKDSTKISEYAALGKPIVATGYSRSDQYLLTEQNADAFAEGILRCFDEQVRPATPHFWEDHESDFLQNVQDALKF